MTYIQYIYIQHKYIYRYYMRIVRLKTCYNNLGSIWFLGYAYVMHMQHVPASQPAIQRSA